MTISEVLIEDIEKKRQKIIENPDYFLKRSQLVKRQLKGVSRAHSFWIEHPDMRNMLIDGGKREQQRVRKCARKGVQRMQDAWKYLSSVGRTRNFLSVFGPEIILKTGAIVEPGTNSDGFRDVRVSLGFSNYVPPNPVKVPELIGKLSEDLERSDYFPVEAAATVHLHLAGIQPFREGNKRIARLIQDRILTDYELPPALIPAGEREVYLDLLEQGLVGIKERDYAAQRPFFDYIGGKINVELDDILKDLDVSIK